jgi:hypothetical protein
MQIFVKTLTGELGSQQRSNLATLLASIGVRAAGRLCASLALGCSVAFSDDDEAQSLGCMENFHWSEGDCCHMVP